MSTIKEKEETLNEQIQRLLAEADLAINEASSYLISQGKTVDLTSWVTQKEYCKRFNIENIATVNNWIRRGIIPPENIMTVPELNDIRLIKAIPYQE